jgi:hypothetical protein
MKLLSNPTVVDGQNHSKNRAYRQQCASDYLVVLFFFFFFYNFLIIPTKNPKTIIYNKKRKNMGKSSKSQKKKKKVCWKVGSRFWFIGYRSYNII